MLKELKVRDLALVAEAGVRFEPGLNLLTGETGSGKSLIIDALGLALGGRAATDQVRHGAERATVEAVFGGAQGPVTLQREIGRRSAARLDGRPSTPSHLRDVGQTLVAMHGQHEHHALLDTRTQTELLDALAGTALRTALAQAHGDWSAASARVADLERMSSRGEREREFLRWQLDELNRAKLVPGEDTELSAERGAVRHAAKLAELGHEAADRLRDDGIARAAVALRSAAELDPRLTELAARVAALEDEAADAAAGVRRYTDAIDADPARLEAIESRLALLDGIKKKYGGSLESALEERRRLQTQLDVTEDLAGAIAGAQREAGARRADLEDATMRLTAARRDAAARLEEGVVRELEGLRLDGARFAVELRPQTDIGPDGAEVAEMMFSANPGEPLAPLARVASGGELARLMLAIKTVTAAADRLPTLVFDEVDAGIGGEAAVQVGMRLKALGARHQVLVVTHLAQIASFADHHLVVEKAPGPDGRNVVTVRELKTADERAAELARMMSGGTTPKALARARELLDESQRGGRQKALQRS